MAASYSYQNASFPRRCRACPLSWRCRHHLFRRKQSDTCWVFAVVSTSSVRRSDLVLALFEFIGPRSCSSGFFHEPSRIEKSSLVVACIVLATLSWRFVEKPFRVTPHRLTPKAHAHSGGRHNDDGHDRRIASWSQHALLLELSTASTRRHGLCRDRRKPYAGRNLFHHRRICGPFARSTAGIAAYRLARSRPNFLLIGDSHAAHLWSGLQTTYPSSTSLQRNSRRMSAGLRRRRRGTLHWHGPISLQRVLAEQPSRWRHHLGALGPKDLPELISTVRAIRRYASRVIVVGPIVQYGPAFAANTRERNCFAQTRTGVRGAISPARPGGNGSAFSGRPEDSRDRAIRL